MRLVRSERASAALLLCSAVLGLVLANTGAGPALHALMAMRLGPSAVHLDLGIAGWISDGLLAIFFFIVAVELRHELTVGELSSWQRALHPAIAAVCGVVVPALAYLGLTAGSGFESGWPVPTATDIAFALGVLAVFGRRLPRRIRVFLLALAVLDDLIAIVIIAVFFTSSPDLLALGLAVVTTVAFGLVSRMLHGRLRAPAAVALVLLGILTWGLVHASGVHPTIAGVALGLVMSRAPARRTVHVLQPWSNALILPLFAFTAASVAIPQIPLTRLAAPFWGIVVALPVGKFVGIAAGTWLGDRPGRSGIAPVDSLVVAALGGIGFTVSLLMNELAFPEDATVRGEGVLAVLAGSAVSMVAGAVAVTLLSRRHRRLHPPAQPRP